MGVPSPVINGFSWFAVEVIESFPSLQTSQAQPEPNLVIAAFANSSLNLSKDPKEESIKSARFPEGDPPPLGDMMDQNKEWL